VEENLADLHAALAANRRGVAAVHALVEAHGVATLRESMAALTARAAELMTAAITRLPDGRFEGRQHLDDGTPLAVRIEIHGGRAVIDFSGSGAVHPGNLNATRAIVTSAVLYVLRLLVGHPLPLNEGLLGPVELKIPRGVLDPAFDTDPERCPAVVGGNVETSQRVVDTLLAAFELAACSQGTMNNVIFGDGSFGFYETIGGGSGAGPGFAGAAAVHTHMTNTRLTDVEIMEHRFPVRVRRCAIRHGSGGPGRWRGGDGMVREIEFLAPVELSLLSQHRRERPYGARGGEPGAPGEQWIVRRDGTTVALDGIDTCRVTEGDRLVIETPGGGGWEPGG
jgi:5-oxoprolinase (ATP-hydrolysing)